MLIIGVNLRNRLWRALHAPHPLYNHDISYAVGRFANRVFNGPSIIQVE